MANHVGRHHRQGALMSTQRERVNLLARRLITTETARRKAVRDGNRKLHNDLANLNREMIGDASSADLRSLVTVWMLMLGAAHDRVARYLWCADGGGGESWDQREAVIAGLEQTKPEVAALLRKRLAQVEDQAAAIVAVIAGKDG